MKLDFCARCQIAQYCSKDCQEKDWKKHKKDCVDVRKKENVPPNISKKEVKSESPSCWNCDKTNVKLHSCALCQIAEYCSKDCEGWHSSKHRILCQWWINFDEDYRNKIKSVCRTLNDRSVEEISKIAEYAIRLHAINEFENNILNRKNNPSESKK